MLRYYKFSVINSCRYFQTCHQKCQLRSKIMMIMRPAWELAGPAVGSILLCMLLGIHDHGHTTVLLLNQRNSVHFLIIAGVMAVTAIDVLLILNLAACFAIVSYAFTNFHPGDYRQFFFFSNFAPHHVH
ncbi:hypothetical protein V1514DRAFT_173312 [Lipomyces japonicus]|uniref:uncharacterized protein n=1 Tax=Lipomyces japonicus TaxID=56871 RepID=UPI0034CF6660